MQNAHDSSSRFTTILSQADALLLERRFTIEDPSAISGLAHELPLGESSPQIIFKYDTKASGRPKLRCAHCRGARHWKGYVVLLANGQPALLAERQCGRDAFGFKWDTIERDFNADRSRQLDLQRMLVVEPILEPLIAELETAVASGGLRGHARYMTDLRTTFGRFGQALAKMARQEGRLEATQLVRNRAKEEDAVRRLRPGLIYDVERATEQASRDRARRALDRYIEQNCKVEEPAPHVIGSSRGWSVFIPGPSPQDILEQAIASLVKTQSALNESVASLNFALILKEVSVACEDITRALSLANELEHFLIADNLQRIVRWASLDKALPYAFRVEGTTLRDTHTGNQLALDAAWSIPKLPGLDRMKAALRNSSSLTNPALAPPA